jgi:hypothetical protein
MMFGELYRYFITHKQLAMPGIGTFQLERKPASVDFPNKLINAPSFSIALHHGSTMPGKHFFAWLGHALKVGDRDAVIRFNDFAFELRRRIQGGDHINWEGMGKLSLGLAGEIRFEPALKDAVLEAPVKAEKVIREKAEHTVRVGEDEKTSAEMIEMLNQPTAKKNYWWAAALAIGIVAIMFLGWYFSKHGVKVPSTGNQQTITTGISGTNYRILQ